MARKALKREREQHEDAQKKLARARDQKALGHRCRWPYCTHRDQPLEMAHVRAKGQGGDPEGIRSTSDNLIRLCRPHHLWDPQDGHPEGSIERHNLKIDPLTDLGTNGPCVFSREYVRMKDDGTGLEQLWIVIARERAVGVLDE